ncbi:hypothetical protein [Nocardia macrotermitis]|uniref:Condensation domain-containing protein n=1 Tax=Nocardia macrotermitis TaxID=2585198 RepID=A0A7K0CUB5_9NOCA|nr:hypothetical protein [Nocardia macrotermitis]MQY17061.1 hypothetical protein [Nocardia macrotermitis]
MVDLGWFDAWRPRSGRLITWTVLPSARAAMLETPACGVPVPGWQQRYMRAAYRLAGTECRPPRLYVAEFDVAGHPEIAAMTRAITGFVRRHEMFRSWFAVEPDGRVVCHRLAPDEVELVARVREDVIDSASIGEIVRTGVPDALHWDCFGFGVIEHERSFTTYLALDRLHTGTVATLPADADLLALYRRETCSGGEVRSMMRGRSSPRRYLVH